MGNDQSNQSMSYQKLNFKLKKLSIKPCSLNNVNFAICCFRFFMINV